MKKVLLWLVFVGFLSLPLTAQDSSKSEIFGGFQFGHISSIHTYDPYLAKADNNNTSVTVNGVGWEGTYTFHVSKQLGVSADFSGTYGGSTISEGTGSLGGGTLAPVKYKMKVYTLAFGPVYYFNSQGKFKPYAHVLIGGGGTFGTACSSGIPCAPSLDGLGGVVAFIGGGADMDFKKKMSIRVAQFDWFYSYGEYNSGMGNVRISAGIVYHF
jgi:hypothetical protein